MSSQNLNSLKEYSTHIDSVIVNDETLLRLLYYKPVNYNDDPLDPTKENINDMANKWEIVDDLIVNAPKFDDMKDDTKSRLLFYMGDGRSSNGNFLFSNQEYIFEIFVHFEYVKSHQKRVEWIADRLNEIVRDIHLNGLGKIKFKRRHPIAAPENHIGYRLIFEFVASNY